jgi:1-phosphofructokinase
MTEPSGKGVNVALALHGVDVDVCAVLPVGGGTGREIISALDGLGLDTIGVPIAGAVRSNVSLVEADGRSTKVNEPGPAMSGAEVDALCAAALSARTSDRVLWAGSLPEGFTDARLAGAVADARAAGWWVAVDASGAALEAVLNNDRGKLPHLIKPNADELAEVLGVTLHTVGDVTAAARTLLARGVRTVLVSLGGAGALLVDVDLAEPLHGIAPARRVVNTVGAGDAFLAGFLAEPAGGSKALANALRFGATAVEHDGTLLGVPDPRRAVVMGPARAGTPLT